MANKVTKEQIDAILEAAEYQTFHRVFGKQCIVVAKLPNGFTIVGESACVDPTNYDDDIGFKLAVERIRSKVWELEGYALQVALSTKSNNGHNVEHARCPFCLQSKLEGNDNGYCHICMQDYPKKM